MVGSRRAQSVFPSVLLIPQARAPKGACCVRTAFAGETRRTAERYGPVRPFSDLPPVCMNKKVIGPTALVTWIVGSIGIGLVHETDTWMSLYVPLLFVVAMVVIPVMAAMIWKPRKAK